MDKTVFQHTIKEIYPSYVKKDILKKLVSEGLVINNKRKSSQNSLNLTRCLDVTNYDDIDEKIEHIYNDEEVLFSVEEYEYQKTYRHFAIFKYEDFNIGLITEMADRNEVKVFNKQYRRRVDDFEKPTIYCVDNRVIFKFSYNLKDNTQRYIKYVVLAEFSQDNNILEIKFDRIGIEYRNSDTFYKDIIQKIIEYFISQAKITIKYIDFKAVVEYMKKNKDDITVLAQMMNRNRSKAYLESYDGEDVIIPILGELHNVIDENESLFNTDINTKKIRKILENFLTDIEVKSDIPKIKIRMDNGIVFGITHEYKNAAFSLFMMYGDLCRKELTSSVTKYVIQCYEELRTENESNIIPEKTV